MKVIIRIYFSALFSIFFFSCSKNTDEQEIMKDIEKPKITLNYEAGFPKSCEELKRGKKITIKVKVSDNMGLASYAINLHNNFDHHTHDSQGSKCDLEPQKKATDKTFKFLENYTIKNKPKQYEIIQRVAIPEDVDIGDYHCSISVTDITGWSANTSVDVKIVE